MNNDIKEFSVLNDEPEWLSARRQEALDLVSSLELPNIECVRFGTWKLDKIDMTVSEGQGNVPDFTELPDHPMLVQVGTQTVFEQMSTDLNSKGVVFTDFHSALSEMAEIMEQYLGTATDFKEDRLTAANMASFNSGMVLYIPDNVEIEQPVEAIFQQNSDEAVSFNKRVLIIAGKNSKLNYLERLESIGNNSVKTIGNMTVEVIALD
ncbi:MAG: Fe-S cluster assembly protein SufD, partial [Streptococcaceae bacterium]|nr:Fe-S cluster assembly protein SufD [Streptococcaceae bacterium]